MWDRVVGLHIVGPSSRDPIARRHADPHVVHFSDLTAGLQIGDGIAGVDCCGIAALVIADHVPRVIGFDRFHDLFADRIRGGNRLFAEDGDASQRDFRNQDAVTGERLRCHDGIDLLMFEHLRNLRVNPRNVVYSRDSLSLFGAKLGQRDDFAVIV